MTRKEWIEKNLPAYINRNAGGGVLGCPRTYRELARIDPSVLMSCKKNNGITCTECWNTELNVKEERKKNMTRREFVFQNYAEARNWAEARMKEAVAEGYIVAFPEQKTTKKQPNPPTWNRKE